MREKEVLERAFAMPLTSPAYPPGPYRFVNREYLIITYRTDPAKLRAVVPEPLEIDASRWSNTNSSACRIRPASATTPKAARSFRSPSGAGRGGYTHCMFLNDEPPIAGGRELWGFPKKLAHRRCEPRSTRWSAPWTTGRFGSPPARWATSTVKPISAQVKASLAAPNFLLKIIPHVDGTARICELVEYHLEDIT